MLPAEISIPPPMEEVEQFKNRQSAIVGESELEEM
jgi:hypothetical protein